MNETYYFYHYMTLDGIYTQLEVYGVDRWLYHHTISSTHHIID